MARTRQVVARKKLSNWSPGLLIAATFVYIMYDIQDRVSIPVLIIAVVGSIVVDWLCGMTRKSGVYIE